MREILFRGKEVESGDWYYGDIFHSSMNVDTARIHDYINRANVGIIPDTLGQYTGLTDKNGTKIFEGDIVRNIESGMKALVQFFPEHGAFMAWIRNESFSINQVEYFGEIEMPEIEVISNIYDNPELIGGGENA